MPTREDIVAKALSFDGLYNGHGYDCANRFSSDLGRAAEAWCDDFFTDIYRLCGIPIPSCQPGEATGSSFVPDFWENAQRRGATKHADEGLPGDAWIYHWPGGNPDGDHIEMQVWHHSGVGRTIGGNSGPSNVNSFSGVGGVHQHDWANPAASSDIVGVIDMSHYVDFSAGGPVSHLPAHAPQTGPRPLSLKTPHLKGHDVLELQRAINVQLNKSGGTGVLADGIFGPQTRLALIEAQRTFEDPFGIARAHTRKALGIS